MELNKFRAGYDFLEMRGKVEGGETAELANWWGTFQNAGRNMRQSMVSDLGQSKSSYRRRRPARSKKSKKASD
jgi:poly(A) polymerase